MCVGEGGCGALHFSPPIRAHTDGMLCFHFLQARDDILNGSHPVSFDKACEFGGIQAQIQFGPHIEHKHKPGFLE